jgi:hypothetical protein
MCQQRVWIPKSEGRLGKGNNIIVSSQKEAEAIINEARPGIPARETYGPKSQFGYEVHPPDNSGVDLSHIKWRDWRQGKAGGAEGHIYFAKPN